MAVMDTPQSTTPVTKRGMVLPFQPLSLAFDHVNYYVDMPAVSQPCKIISNMCKPIIMIQEKQTQLPFYLLIIGLVQVIDILT